MKGTRPIVGHELVKEQLRGLVNGSDTAVLLLMHGPTGSGKSACIELLERTAGQHLVDVRKILDDANLDLDPDGKNIRRLINVLRPYVADAGQRAVLSFDDADHDLRDAGIGRFVREVITELNIGILVFTAATPLAEDNIPLLVTNLSLKRRNFNSDDFETYLTAALAAAASTGAAFTSTLRQKLQELCEQTTDFHAVEYIVEMLLALHRSTGVAVGVDRLYDLIHDDDHIKTFRALPAVRSSGDYQMVFQEKDKTEQLAELLMRLYKDKEDLAHAAERALIDFQPKAFLDDAGRSYPDAVMSLCLTRSPVDLVSRLLSPRDLRKEIDDLGLDPSELLLAPKDQAQLLIRAMGFTLIDNPSGLSAAKERVLSAATVFDSEDARTNLVNGAGMNVKQQIESILLDLLHFWGTYLMGSVQNLINSYNQSLIGIEPLQIRRLTLGQIVGLLRYLDVAAQGNEATFLRLLFLDRRHPLSKELLRSCDTFTEKRNEFEHAPHGSPSDIASAILQRRCRALIDAGLDVLENAADGSFPSVIKLSEIVFDEYSRRVFKGIDSDGHPVRFALTNRGDDLAVASHYYLLPPKPVSVNPIVVPRFGSAQPVLFETAAEYDKASDTQRVQGVKLLDFITFEPDERVIDVGCGTGALTLELANFLPKGGVLGIDSSSEMIGLAQGRARSSQLGNVTFEQADLLDYKSGDTYDVVLSNSAMHWILPADKAYAQLFRLLRRGGRLAVHQGGADTYRGLRMCAAQMINDYGWRDRFKNFVYRIYYPTADELAALLRNTGFTDVEVRSEKSDGANFPTLIEDFSHAGLRPFTLYLDETDQERFRTDFVEYAKNQPTDLFTHRLYATARRP